MIKTPLALILLVLCLSACAATGTWVPADPANPAMTQDRMNRDMQQCIASGDQSLNSSGALPGLSMAIRNSHVEECMKRLGYKKLEEQNK